VLIVYDTVLFYLLAFILFLYTFHLIYGDFGNHIY